MSNTIDFLIALPYTLLAAWNLMNAITSWRESKYGYFSLMICLGLLFIFKAAKVIFIGF